MQYPHRWTKPLVADKNGWAVHSKGHRLIELIESRWTFKNGKKPEIDEWQRFFLINALEIFPPDHPEAGHLRYRAILFSCARQNGKSTLAAWISLYLMTQHVAGPNVIGISETREHAKVIYGALVHAINNDKSLAKALKPTGTRGITKTDGSGSYNLYPAKENKLQGLATTGALIDEVHLLQRQAWDSLVNGQAAQPDSLIIGLTTAGDDLSELLISLYQRADQAIMNPDSDVRFGAFIWEAHNPEATYKDTDAVHQANPALEAGRISIETRLQDVAAEPEWSRRRYLLNLFTTNSSPWLENLDAWTHCKGQGVTDYSEGVHIGIDTGPSESFTTFTAARRTEEGIIETEVVAQVQGFSLEREKEFCEELKGKRKILSWTLDPYRLKDLADHLEKKGRTVHKMNQSANQRAAATMYSLIVKNKIRHADDPVLNSQLPQGIRKTANNSDGSWRIVPAKRGVSLDALHSTLFSVYAAETYSKSLPGLYLAS